MYERGLPPRAGLHPVCLLRRRWGGRGTGDKDENEDEDEDEDEGEGEGEGEGEHRWLPGMVQVLFGCERRRRHEDSKPLVLALALARRPTRSPQRRFLFARRTPFTFPPFLPVQSPPLTSRLLSLLSFQ